MNRNLYKIGIWSLKVLPIILAICYFLGTLFSLFNIDLVFLSYFGFIGIFPFIFIYISSFMFKFCIWHRIPLYYILCINLLTHLDYLFVFSIVWLISFLIIITGIAIILTLYLKKYESKRIIKNMSNTNNK